MGAPFAHAGKPKNGNNRPIKAMRILLQSKQTGLYFKDVGDWTGNSSDALDFLSSTAAIDFCAANKLSDVHLVLKFEEHRYDIVLPVATRSAAPGFDRTTGKTG